MNHSESEIDLDPETCYFVLQNRDTRFDGRFFVGVRTTGIFCRPICPAPLPKSKNCTYWRSAAAAQAAGFRPCLRCRPETAPGTPAWSGTAATVSRALRLIEAGALDGEAGVDDLADRLGMGSRHLRRLFDQHLGATPQAVAKLRRTLFAKQLIDETNLSMTEIAASAGFQSQRRFNACVREVYGRTPSDFRRTAKKSAGKKAGAAGKGEASGLALDSVSLSLAYRPPLAWRDLLDFLAPRAIPGVESVESDCYYRALPTPDGAGTIAVSNDADRNRLRVSLALPSSVGLIDVTTRLRQLFDLDAELESVDAVLAAVPIFRAQVKLRPGLRVPGAFDGFETAVRAILGQQISVQGATTFAGRIAQRWGSRVPRERALHAGLTQTFPGPSELADAKLEEIGVIRARAKAIRGLATSVLEDPSLLQPGSSPAEDLKRWVELKGIGPWTAEYVAMRVLREPDALPASDLGLRKAISSQGGPVRPTREVEEALEACRPYRAYAAIRLWATL